MKLPFFFILFFPLAFGQHVQTYYVPDVQQRPGEILLSPNYLTVLEFDMVVDEWFSGQGAIFALEQAGSKLTLTTGERGGNSDLVVDAGGKTMMFKLVVDPEQTITRRYLIQSNRPETNYLTPSVTTLPLAPPPALPAQNTLELGSFTLGDGRFNEAGQYTLTFEYVNTGPYRVALLPSNVQVIQGNERLNISDVTKEPLRNLVDTNETQQGLLLLESVRAGQLQVFWDVMVFTPNGGVKQTLQAVITAN